MAVKFYQMINISNIADPTISHEWKVVIEFLASHTEPKKNPPKSWYKELSSLINRNISLGEYESFLLENLKSFKKEIPNLVSRYSENDYAKSPFLRGFLHSSILFLENTKITDIIEDITVTSFSKGAQGVPIGNDALYILSDLPVDRVVGSLGKLRSRIKKGPVRSKIATILNNIGKKHGKTANELEEMSISDFGLNNQNELVFCVNDWKGIISFATVNQSEISWTNGTKVQKSPPKEITTAFKEDLKEFTENIKEIKEQLASQCFRIESFYLNDVKWSFEYWEKYYLQHNLVSIIAKNLIWDIVWEGNKVNVTWSNGYFIDSNQAIVENIPIHATVSLWHPIYSTIEEIRNWRKYFNEKQIIQGIKQAFREVYVLTDAELNTKSYSNRFAAHIIQVGTYLTKSRSKGWMGSALLMENFALKIPHFDIKAEFWIQRISQEGEDWYGTGLGATDQVRFYKNKEQIDLKDVPPIVFAEVMRDVDLFIGASSITNNPYWTDNGTGKNTDSQSYWYEHSFGSLRMSGNIRMETLKEIIPMLSIKDVCSFEGNFLKVQGKIRNYKIHVGSGNILMEPNDQYLCIVPDSSNRMAKEKISLPFDNDETLSIIISKALLLAKDNETTDETIISQITSK